MKIEELHVVNFKAIDQISLTDLTDVVVIAGANGSGKSTIFDAIRLWKSTIGSYQKGELQNWLNELGFGNQIKALLDAHQNRAEPFSILATVRLSLDEVSYLKEHAESLLAYYFYKNAAQNHPMAPQIMTVENLELADDFRSQKAHIMQQVAASMVHVDQLTADSRLTGSVEVHTTGQIATNAPFILQLVLSLFVDGIGVIEHYGPQRTFARERVESLNLNIDTQIRSQRLNSALYNHANKYGSVKAELASAYVKGLISERAGGRRSIDDGLERAISELFVQFIPGKSFLGVIPKPDGSLSFDVQTAAGLHDVSDLSSGEKELIYGYLRLKNSGLRNSVILIDEPELHLNPRLTDGLPDFYYRHIGRPLNNQLWLVTHSDTILRQSVGYEGFRVFHMKTVGSYDVDDAQLIEVTAQSDLNQAVIELVGDLAAFKPGGKLVLLEGGGESEFDKRLIQRLFPDFSQRVNLVSSESKMRVQALHGILERIGAERDLFSGVYSIVDADDSLIDGTSSPFKEAFIWDAYHIENYLIDPHFVRKVLLDNEIIDEDTSSNTVFEWLREAARSTKDALVRHEVESKTRNTLSTLVKVNTDRSLVFKAERVGELIDETVSRINKARELSMSSQALTQMADAISKRLDHAIENYDWVRVFRGREVLKAFVHARGKGRITYESLRNQVSARMRDVEFQPVGMGRVLAQIDSAGVS